MKYKSLIITLLIGMNLVLASCCSNKEEKESSNKVAKVELKKENDKYQLYVNDKPFYIKGAGLEFGKIESLAKHGGNALRTWRVDNGKVSGKEVLDEAQKNGLMVCMGLEVARERHGFDYGDKEAVKKQLEQIKKDVEELKNHPALLMWGIGNELNLRSTNTKIWDAVNDIASMIHEIDPNHPTTTMLAGADKQDIHDILNQCPDLDLISFQLYGKIVELPKFLMESDYQGAYMVTEWGATGHWEVEQTSWNEPIEQNSSVKATAYHERYTSVIAADSNNCIGSFVFLWGQKQERTPTWYGVFLENGDKTASVDVMEYVWTGKWPMNRSPEIKSMTLNNLTAYNNVTLEEGKSYNASCLVIDPEGDSIKYNWAIMKEVSPDKKSDGGDFEPRPETLLEIKAEYDNFKINFSAPTKGIYRLFVYASDENGSTATANIPFMVK